MRLVQPPSRASLRLVEAAGGLHAANRMGGNGLSESLLFGARAGSAAAAYAKQRRLGDCSALLRRLEERARRWETISSGGRASLNTSGKGGGRTGALSEGRSALSEPWKP